MKFIRRFNHERIEMKMDINVIDDEGMFISTFFEGELSCVSFHNCS